MRKMITAAMAALTLAGGSLALTAPAEARGYGGWHGGGYHGGYGGYRGGYGGWHGGYGGWHGGYGGWHRGYGWGVGAGLAGVAIGAALADSYYAPRYPAYYGYPAYYYPPRAYYYGY